MNKKYQIFISSTYQDLQTERAAIFQRIIEFGQIPAGMEFFPAIGSDPLMHMKKVIDNCDYFILMVAGRYGTLHKNSLSFTEVEYNYALEKNIPILAFLHENTRTLPTNKIDIENSKKQKLNTFKTNLTKNNNVFYWSTQQELESALIINLSKAINEDSRPSWERVFPDALKKLQQQIDSLTKKLTKANKQNTLSQQEIHQLKNPLLQLNFDFADQQLFLHGLIEHDGLSEPDLWSAKTNWKELFLSWAPRLLTWTDDKLALHSMNLALANSSEGVIYHLNKNLFQDIKIKFWQTGLIEINKTTNMTKLSPLGEIYLQENLHKLPITKQ